MKDFYNEVNLDERLIEVIYVSCDKTETEFKDAYKCMPWCSFPYTDKRHKLLTQKFSITGVPKVFTLDGPTGFAITDKARKDICDLGVNCLKNWAEEKPDMIKKQEHLAWGARLVEEARIQAEIEAKKKAAEEKDL